MLRIHGNQVPHAPLAYRPASPAAQPAAAAARAAPPLMPTELGGQSGSWLRIKWCSICESLDMFFRLFVRRHASCEQVGKMNAFAVLQTFCAISIDGATSEAATAAHYAVLKLLDSIVGCLAWSAVGSGRAGRSAMIQSCS